MSTKDPQRALEEAAAQLDGLQLSEPSDDASDEVQKTHEVYEEEEEEEDDDDEQNEFLNSSSFLSNSQIIRTSNVNNLKPTSTNEVSSPIKRDRSDDKARKRRGHFQLFAPRETSTRTSTKDVNDTMLSSDGEGQDSDRDDDNNKDHDPNSSNSEDMKSTKFIDIDDPRATPKLPKMHPDSTPWRRLRPQSSLRTKDAPPKSTNASINFVQSLFDNDPSTLNDGMTRSPMRSVSLFETTSHDSNGEFTASTTSTSAFEMENLRKQITNYKLQQRLLTEFIRNIIKNSGNPGAFKEEIMSQLEKQNDLLLHEREHLQKELKTKSEESIIQDQEKYNEKVKEVLELKNDLISMKELNDQLSLHISDLKAQLTGQENIINDKMDEAERWEKMINDILSVLIQALEGDSLRAVKQARDSSKFIDTKLQVVSLALHEVLQKYEKLSSRAKETTKENIPPSLSVNHIHNHSAPLTNIDKSQLQNKLDSSKQVEQELRNLLSQQSSVISDLKTEYTSLQYQFKENLQFSANLKRLLNEKRSKISDLNNHIFELETKLEELSDSKTSGDQVKETQLWKNRLNIVKINHSKEIEKLQGEIEELKIKLQNSSTKTNDRDLSTELLQRERLINDLNKEINSLNTQLINRQKENDPTILNLNSLLHNAREDYDNLVRDYNQLQQEYKDAQDELLIKERDYRRKLEHAAKELNLAVTKQRTLAAEKSKLTFALDDCKREKSSLTMNNNTLTEKVGRLSYQISTLTNYETGFNNLCQLQIEHFTNTLHNFDSILEKSSYAQARQKLEKLSESELDFDQIFAVIRSLSMFFENALSYLISDHKQLLMNHDSQNDFGLENEDLKKQVEELKDELNWYYENANLSKSDNDSPRTKLRISDLEKKRKAERERRKLEYDESSKLVAKLEQENKELRLKLSLANNTAH